MGDSWGGVVISPELIRGCTVLTERYKFSYGTLGPGCVVMGILLKLRKIEAPWKRKS